MIGVLKEWEQTKSIKFEEQNSWIRHSQNIVDEARDIVKRIDDFMVASCTSHIGEVPVFGGFYLTEGKPVDTVFTINFNDIRGERVLARNVRNILSALTSGPRIEIARIVAFEDSLLRMK